MCVGRIMPQLVKLLPQPVKAFALSCLEEGTFTQFTSNMLGLLCFHACKRVM